MGWRAARRGLEAEDRWRLGALDDLASEPNSTVVGGVVSAMTTRPGDGEAHLDARNTRLNVGERPGIADVDVRVGANLLVRGRIDMRSAAEGGAPNRIRHWAQAQAVSGGR
ncbi:MAG: hypothetical protein RIR33_1487 [Pseudomonadota bacterium]|jgi:hypothetical protein